jgi:hypothetical protein
MFLTRSPGLRTSAISGALALLVLCGLMASQAQARVFIGVGVPLFFPPFVAAPPAYYPPYYAPPYYAPPAVYAPPDSNFSYAPPSSQPQNLAPPPGYGSGGYGPGGYGPGGGYGPTMGSGTPYGVAQSCQAGAYVCPLTADTPPGGRCSCPGQNGQRVKGQAN